jgi:hypothetical protein
VSASLSLWACAGGPALPQSSPDKHDPSEQILRCGAELAITALLERKSSGPGAVALMAWAVPWSRYGHSMTMSRAINKTEPRS